MTDKEKILAAHLAAMCCQADEDCPSEYRTEHFRSTMDDACLLYTSPSPRDKRQSRMPSSA